MSDVIVTPPAPARISPPPETKAARPRRRLLLKVGVPLLALVVLAGSGTAWVAMRGLAARDHLQRAAQLVRQLRTELAAVDPAAGRTVTELQQQTKAARAEVEDPLWRLATGLPEYGDDLAAVSTVAVALDDLAHQGLPALASASSAVDTRQLLPRGGRFALDPLRTAAPFLTTADAATRAASERVNAINTDGLTPTVGAAVTQLQSDLRQAAKVTATAARSAALLPTMLGADGPRTYLVLFQNLAEVRATGGMPGAYLVIRAAGGRIAIIDQGAAAETLPFDKPVLPLSPSDVALYTTGLGTFPANVNLTPNFPTAAQLAREMYRRHSGRKVDGVLATDPVALGYLLRSIGPVRVPGGDTLTADNTAATLLSRVYVDRDPKEQDEYFNTAAQAIFEALLKRPLAPAAVLAALGQAAGERRMLVWSTRSDENERLAGTVLAGVLPVDDDNRPTVGVFLNDGTGAKLSYYLDPSAQLTVTSACRRDQRRELRLRMTLRSTAPKRGLSSYVLGLKGGGAPYTVRTNVALYSPTDGLLESVSLDGRPVAVGSGRDGRRMVGITTVDLRPGQARTLDVGLLTAPVRDASAAVRPQLRTTPLVVEWQQSSEMANGCRRAR